MTEFERRYRSVLRMLPQSYRDEWADVMVATFQERMATDDVAAGRIGRRSSVSSCWRSG